MGPAVLACIATASLLGVAGAEAPEPSFEGKSLSYWMTVLREVPKDPSLASQDWRKAPWAVGKIGVPALPGLIEALDDESAQVRLRAIRPILAMGADASDAAPKLAGLLKDTDAGVRQWSAAALGLIGPAAAGATPALNAALKDDQPAVRQAAAAALGAIGVQESIPLLREATNDPNKAVQRAARVAIERLEGKTRPAEGDPSPAPEP
jgi:HEAT repeat protein